MITALLRERLVDRLVVCVAPKIPGTGIEAVGDLGFRELARTLRMADTHVVPHGVDPALAVRVEYPVPPATFESEE
jgi:riboflavin biosynthesis pyrimidine reductase